MAQASTEYINFRNGVTDLIRQFNKVDDVLSNITDMGANQTEWAAFFQTYFNENPNGDTTFADAGAAVTALQEIKTLIDSKRTILGKMKI